MGLGRIDVSGICEEIHDGIVGCAGVLGRGDGIRVGLSAGFRETLRCASGADDIGEQDFIVFFVLERPCAKGAGEWFFLNQVQPG